jgi:hypothetical protein
MAKKQTPDQREIRGRVVHEFKHGELAFSGREVRARAKPSQSHSKRRARRPAERRPGTGAISRARRRRSPRPRRGGRAAASWARRRPSRLRRADNEPRGKRRADGGKRPQLDVQPRPRTPSASL